MKIASLLSAALLSTCASAFAVQPGDILITEFYEGWFKINPSTNAVSPLNYMVTDSTQLAADGAGNVYFTDELEIVSRLNLISGQIVNYTVPSASFINGIAIEADGAVWIAEDDSVDRVSVVQQASSVVTTDEFFAPRGVAVSASGRVFTTEFFGELWEVNRSTGAIHQVTNADLGLSSLITVQPSGNLIVLDFDNRLIRVNPDTGAFSVFSSNIPDFPAAMTVDAAGDVLMTSTQGVFRFNSTTGARSLIASGTFFNPLGIAVVPPSSVPLVGDYNADGVVSAADYTRWKQTYGSTSTLSADGNGDGVIDAADYTVWRDALTASSKDASTAIPEPASCVVLGLLASTYAVANRR